MLQGVALAKSLVPVQFAEKHGLASRLVNRGGEAEYQFLWSADTRMLPIWDGDQHRGSSLRLVSWSCRRPDSRWLPLGPCTTLETVESGSWKPFRPRRVEIPATVVLEGGIWALVQQGLHGLLVKDERDVERLYVICEPSSYYFRVMTRAAWMPLMIGERF
jgi:hypothetical protein